MAIALADLLRERGERPVAISADALQVYVGLGTLTGAPSDEERARLEHRLVGFVPLTEAYSVGEFMPRAHAEIDSALAEGWRPIVVGGTGLYLRAALCELDLRPPAPLEVRESLERRLRARGLAELHAELRDRAPGAAEGIASTDRSRILRSLELLELEERPEPEPGLGGSPSQLWTEEVRRPTALVGIVMERSALYERIDARVEAISAAGAVDEVRGAEAAGASRTARKAVGYEELLAGDLEGMKRRSRNYAKRQLTWMRKLAGIRTVDATARDPAAVAAEVARLVATPARSP